MADQAYSDDAAEKAREYERPEVVVLGSVMDVTQNLVNGTGADSAFSSSQAGM